MSAAEGAGSAAAGGAPDAGTAPTPAVAAIAWRGVRKEFGRTVALAGVDLAVAPGRVVVLLGPNGAGKTTLLRIGAGLSRPTEGGVVVHGAEGAAARARIGYLGHATLLYASLTPVENLLFAGQLYGARGAAARADRLLDAAGVSRRARDPVARLSRGTQQRVALCRALLHEPAILLLDEPFTGLDPDGVALLSRWIREHAARGGSALLSTHDLDAGLGVADAVAVLARGRLAALRDAAGLGGAAVRALYDEAVRAAAA